MVIYADILFAVNFVMNALVLGVVRAVTGGGRARLWVAAGAAVAALLHTLAVAVPVLQGLHPLPTAAAILAAGVWISERPRTRRAFGTAMAVALGATAVFGGAGTALHFLTGGVAGLFQMVDWRVAAVAAAGSYAGLKLSAAWLTARAVKRQTTVEIAALLGDAQVAFTALVDTGHTLAEPISGLPVIICEEALAAPLFSSPAADTKIRMVPFTSLGQSAGMLTAVRVSASVNNSPKQEYYIAATPQKLCPAGRFRGLAGAMVLAADQPV